jgi:hypothetical protein
MPENIDQERARLLNSHLRKRELLMEMVKIMIPIADADPLARASSSMYRLSRNTLRRNVMRVQSAALLLEYEKMSDSALAISRNIIEDAVSLSFILSGPNPESFSMQFFEFRWVQAKQDFDYYSRIPDYIGPDLNTGRQQIEEEYRRVIAEYPDFTDREGNARNSWTDQGIEGMLKILVRRNVYSRAEKRNMLRTYQLGSRETHLNPDNILEYHDQNTWTMSDIRARDTAIKSLAAGLTSIYIRYIDTVIHYKKTYTWKRNAKRMNKLLEKIHQDS